MELNHVFVIDTSTCQLENDVVHVAITCYTSTTCQVATMGRDKTKAPERRPDRGRKNRPKNGLAVLLINLI